MAWRTIRRWTPKLLAISSGDQDATTYCLIRKCSPGADCRPSGYLGPSWSARVAGGIGFPTAWARLGGPAPKPRSGAPEAPGWRAQASPGQACRFHACVFGRSGSSQTRQQGQRPATFQARQCEVSSRSPRYMATPAMVPTPNSCSRRTCSKSSNFAIRSTPGSPVRPGPL